MFSKVQNLYLVVIATWMVILTSIANVQPPEDNGSSAEIYPESIVCPGEPIHCACWMLKNPTYMYVACNILLINSKTDLSMFNETIIPSKMLLQCDPRNLFFSKLSDGVFESLHAFFSIEIKGCHLTHISRQAFRGMSSLKNIIIQGGHHINMDRECLQIPHLSNLETLNIIESGLYFAPVLCGREHLWLVNLTRNNLTTFADAGLVCDHPTNVTIIDVSENAIRDIPPVMCDVTGKLMGFFASNNKIREITPTIFENLTSVVEINLSGNRIFSFPTDFLGINSKMQTLQLAHNIVGSLPRGIFSLTPNITFLNLNDMALTDDMWYQLNNLSRLQLLLLNSNKIRLIDKEVLSEMKQLIVLDLSNNNLSSISNRLFKSQSELKVLNLTRNNITFIEKDAFMGLQKLIKLDIRQNNIRSIHPEALVELSYLLQLNLSCNIIKTIPMFPASLQLLDLRKNEIIYIDSKVFSGLKNLIGINLAHNNINFVHQNAFKNNAKLQLLQLAYNSISLLDYHTFPWNSSLTSLFLDHNNISNIWTFSNEYFPHLRVFDISNNKLNSLVRENFGQDPLFPDSIEELYFAWNEITYIGNFVFQLPSLRYVDLRENRIESLSNLALVASEKNIMPVIYHISGNPFLCDCQLQWLKDVFMLQKNFSHASIIIRDESSLFCKSVYQHEPNLMKYIGASGFLCPYVNKCISLLCNCCALVKCHCRTKCPDGCNCYRTRNWQDADIVDCLGANLTSIPSDISTTCTAMDFSENNLSFVSSVNFDALSGVMQLKLRSCQIREIENGSFKWLSKLVFLDLSYNLLQSLNERMFEGLDSLISLSVSFNRIHLIEDGTFKSLKSLLYLDLTSNQLKRLSVNNFKRLSTISSLNISENPWSCDCSYLEDMKNFTIANAGKIKDIQKVSCLFHNVTSNETVNYPLAGVHLPDLCVNQTTFYNGGTNNLDTAAIVAMSTVLSLFVLGIVIFGVLFWNREFLKVWCFVKFGWKWHQKETEEDAHRPFDAFVSYSSDDEQFVIRELVPYLEESQKGRPGYRLCVHYRDFAVGASIAESIISAVEHSKRVIIILSENFLHSEWCQFEFQKAHLQLLEEKRNRIIMILLHDIDHQMFDNQLRDYIKTRTYVKYGDPWFWAKVEYAMPKLAPPVRQNEVVQPDGIPNDFIRRQVSMGEGDLVNDDTDYILDNMRNHEVDDPKQVAFETEIEQQHH